MTNLRNFAATLFIETFFFWTFKRIYASHIRDQYERTSEAQSITGEAFNDFEKDKINYTVQTLEQHFPPLYQEHRGLAMQIITNKIIRHFHKSKRNSTNELNDADLNQPYSTSPMTRMDIQQILNIIQDKFGNEVVEMFKLISIGYQYDEIADQLNKPTSTVKTNVRRARIFLKSLF